MINVGIIGCGVIAPSHIQSYKQIDGVEVKWVCDLVEDRARKRAEEFEVPQVATDYHQVLSDPEVSAVSVCTDHSSHREIAVAALRAGKHVVCEKALTSTREGLDLLQAEVEKHPDLVFSGILQHRYDSVYRKLRELISEGAFGQVLTANLNHYTMRSVDYYKADKWRGTWEKEGGSLLINQSIHFVDIIQWLMGGVESVSGRLGNMTHGDAIETEDTAVISLQFGNGAFGSITATTSCHKVWEPTLTITGTDGFVDIRDGRLLRCEFEDAEKQKTVQEAIEAAQDAGKVETGKAYYGPSHPTQIADFVGAIREKRQPYVGVKEARESVDLVLAVYRANKEGCWINV